MPFIRILVYPHKHVRRQTSLPRSTSTFHNLSTIHTQPQATGQPKSEKIGQIALTFKVHRTQSSHVPHMTTVQGSLEERMAIFQQSREACRPLISNYKTCMQEHYQKPNNNFLHTNHPCSDLYLLQNICTGRFVCSLLAKDAEQNIAGSHERLAACQKNFLTRLNKDYRDNAASKLK